MWLKKLGNEELLIILEIFEELKVIPTTLEFHELIQKKKAERLAKTWIKAKKIWWEVTDILNEK